MNKSCPHCNGRGVVPLTGVYEDTLRDLRKFCANSDRRYVVANKDHKRFGCKPTALNNRLARLEALGFVVSTRCGRQRRFRPATLRACQS